MCLPAAHSTVDTWIQNFGLQPMPHEDLYATCKHLHPLIFPGTKVLHKQLLPPLPPKQGPLMNPPRIEEPAGPLTGGQTAVDIPSETQQAVNAEAVTSSLPVLEAKAEASTAATTKATLSNMIVPLQTQSGKAPMPPSAAAAGAAHDTPMIECPSAADHGQFLNAS